MTPILKYGATLGAFSTTFYFSYSGAEVQKMTLGDLFDNPIIYTGGDSSQSGTIEKTSLNAIACLISKGQKQKEKCSTSSTDTNPNKPYIHKYDYMKMYPEVEGIFNNSWQSNSNEYSFDEQKLFPPLMKWCEKKRGEYITTIDQRLMWHMITFCSAGQRPFKRE